MPYESSHHIEDPLGKHTSGGAQTKIYRYIDFAKFSRLLKDEQLHFHQAADFGDKFEGTVPEEVKLAQKKEYKKAFKRGDLPEHGPEIHAEINRCLRQFTFFNCWHMQNTESVAMWEKYGGSSRAVAIQTTVDKLRRALLGDTDSYRIHFGEVDYIAYREESETDIAPDDVDPEDLDDRFLLTRNPNSLAPFVYKRNGYAYEEEMRAIIQRPPTLDTSGSAGTKLEPGKGSSFDNESVDISVAIGDENKYIDATAEPEDDGIDVDIFVDELIDTVHFAPDADDWFKDTVKKEMKNCDPLLENQDIEDLVEDSILDDDVDPYY
jgi:hypothetical protein